MMERLSWAGAVPRLAGSRCGSCGHVTVPRRAVCPSCGRNELTDAEFGPDGLVERHVDLHVPLGSIEAPYTIGFVRLREGPLILGRIEGAVSMGTAVELRGERTDDVYWFETTGRSGGDNDNAT